MEASVCKICIFKSAERRTHGFMHPDEKYQKIWNQGELRHRIGRFYERLVMGLSGATRCTEANDLGTDKGDLFSHEMSCKIEVKGSGNIHPPSILSDQLDDHLEEVAASFPDQISYVYALCFYKSSVKVNGVAKSNTASLNKTQDQLEAYLARQTSMVYFVDSEIMDLIRQKYGVRNFAPKLDGSGHRQAVAGINQTLLQDIARSAYNQLHDLGMNGSTKNFLMTGERSIPIIPCRKKIHGGHQMDFGIVPLVHKQTRSMILARQLGHRAYAHA